MYKVNIVSTNMCNAYEMPVLQGSPGVCGFCFRQEKEVFTSFDTVTKVIQKIASLPIEKNITITGGEPLVYNEIVKLVKICDANGLKVSLHTNGLLLKDKISDLVPYVKYISVPFDGCSSEISDYYRGIGYFEIQQENLQLLKNLNIHIGLHTLLTPVNYVVFEKMVETVTKESWGKNIWYWYIKKYKKINLAAKNYVDEYTLDNHSYEKAVNYAISKCDNFDVYPSRTIKKKPTLFLNLAGDVYIYQDGKDENIFVGNILTSSFENIDDNIK